MRDCTFWLLEERLPLETLDRLAEDLLVDAALLLVDELTLLLDDEELLLLLLLERLVLVLWEEREVLRDWAWAGLQISAPAKRTARANDAVLITFLL